MMRAPPCSRLVAQSTASSSSRPIAPTQCTAMPAAPRRTTPAAARRPRRGRPAPRRADPDAGEPDRRVPVRERVGERRIVHDLTPGRSASTMNSVGPWPSAIATTMWAVATSPLVTNHFSPSITQPSPPRARWWDARRVGAGVLLGHRVRQSAARRAATAPGSARSARRCPRASTLYAVGSPPQPVGAAAELLVHEATRPSTSPARRAPPRAGRRPARPRAPRPGCARPRRRAARRAPPAPRAGAAPRQRTAARDVRREGHVAVTTGPPRAPACAGASSAGRAGSGAPRCGRPRPSRRHRGACRRRTGRGRRRASRTEPARRRAHEGHLVEALLALEDRAADEAEDALEVGGASTSWCTTASATFGATAATWSRQRCP